MAENLPVLLTDAPSPLVLDGSSDVLDSLDTLSAFLLRQYGGCTVPVSDAPDMTLSAWFALGDSRGYLKDWHVNREKKLFVRPSLFREDWLNDAAALADSQISDYEFLYWGVAGTHTARHIDVMNSFSWSLNLVGMKRWTFYIGGSEISVNQGPMTAVFVPSGLEHEVENLTECISVNCNWFNRYNAQKVLEFVKNERLALIKELAAFDVSLEIDHEHKTDNIETMMRASCGLKVKDLHWILGCAGEKTIRDQIERDFPHLF